MPVQTFNNLEIDTHDFKLKLSLHIGNLEIIKNHIHNDTLNIYLRTNRLFNSERYLNDNLVVSDTFVMIDTKKNQFKYDNQNYKDTFKDVIVNNKFFRDNNFPIFFINDIFVAEGYDTDSIRKKLTNMAQEIIDNIM
jgi:hypothetical protein